MKNRIISILLLLSTAVCKAQTKIEIIYLTANAYCPSVEQIETYTKQVVDSLFVTEKQSGLIKENKLNIFEDANQDFIHKWEISTNGIVFLVSQGEEKHKVDLNDFAFSNVPSDIPFYKKELENIINDILHTSK